MNKQLRLSTTHAQAVSFGVGGSVVDAKNDEFWDGQVGKTVEPAPLRLGVFGPVAFEY